MKLYVYNTTRKDSEVTLWGISESNQIAVHIKGLKTSICVETPSPSEHARLVRETAALAEITSVHFQYEKVALKTLTSNETLIPMTKVVMQPFIKKDLINHLRYKDFVLHDTDNDIMTDLHTVHGFSCCTWIYVDPSAISTCSRNAKTGLFEYSVTLKDLDFRRFAEDKSIPSMKCCSIDIETCGYRKGGVGAVQYSSEHRDPCVFVQLSFWWLNEDAMGNYDEPDGTVPIRTEAFMIGSERKLIDSNAPNSPLDNKISPCRVISRRVEVVTTERELLMLMQECIIRECPQIITGFNIMQFDLVCLLERSNAVTKECNWEPRWFNPANEAPETMAHPLREGESHPLCWSLDGSRLKITKHTVTTNQAGARAKNRVENSSMLFLDILPYVFDNQATMRLERFTLNAVVQHELSSMSKVDLSGGHDSIHTMLHGDDNTRLKLIRYSCVDSELCCLLFEKLLIYSFYGGLAIASGPSPGMLQCRGQQFMIRTLFVRQCVESQVVLPYSVAKRDHGTFKGATVVAPETKFWEQPITTMDFSAMYPSIMSSNNLCATTCITIPEHQTPPEGYKPITLHKSEYDEKRIVELDRGTTRKEASKIHENSTNAKITSFFKAPKRARVEVDETMATSFRHLPKVIDVAPGERIASDTEDYNMQTEDGDGNKYTVYVNTKRIGISVHCLANLTKMRAKHKKLMNQAKDDGNWNQFRVHSGLQLAYKVCANSMYGFWGADSNPLRNKSVATAVTSIGRSMLLTIIMLSQRFSCYQTERGWVYRFCPPPSDLAAAACKRVFGELKKEYWFHFPDAQTSIRPDTVMIEPQTAYTRVVACDVVYGDTDSIFCRIPIGKINLDSIQEFPLKLTGKSGWDDPVARQVIFLSRVMCKVCTAYFKEEFGDAGYNTVSLEYEKVWANLLLSDKKKYSGARTDEPWVDKKTGQSHLAYPYLDTKGLESVRRSTSAFNREIFLKITQCILKGKLEEAKDALLRGIRALRSRSVNPGLLIRSAKLSKSIVSYKKSSKGALPIHVQLAERLEAANDPDAPKEGSRIPFFVSCGLEKKTSRGVSPRQLIRDKLDLDSEYYLESLINGAATLFRLVHTNGSMEHAKTMLEKWAKEVPLRRSICPTSPFGKRLVCECCGALSFQNVCDACLKLSDEEKARIGQSVRMERLAAVQGCFDVCSACMNTDFQTTEGQRIIETCFNTSCPTLYDREGSLRDLEEIVSVPSNAGSRISGLRQACQ